MQNINYLKYLFSDRQAKVYWSFILIVTIFISLMILIANYNEKKFWADLGLVYILIFVYWIFYTRSYINLLIQKRCISFYKRKIVGTKVEKINVEIYADSFFLKAPKRNFEVKFNIPSKGDTFNIIRLNNYIIILGKFYILGVFRRHCRPIMVYLEGEKPKKSFFGVIRPKIKSFLKEDSNLIINFKNSINGVKRIKLLEFYKTS